jgi:hypothetical protein
MSIVAPSACIVVHEPVVHAAVGVPAHEPPAVHASPVVQAMPSSQGVPGAAGVWVQPLGETHASVVQGLPSSQLTGLPPVHAPAWHVLPVEHASVAHAVPLATLVWTHAPITTVSVVQGFMSSQFGVEHVGIPPTFMHAWFIAAHGFGVHGSLVQPPMPSS